jgi:hypothetical protein
MTGATTENTPCNDIKNKDLEYLDRHDVSCPADKILLSFRMVSDGCSGDQMRFRYNCAVLQTTTPTTTTLATTTTTPEPYPTDFVTSGCRRVKGEIKDAYVDPSGMTHNKCFARCRTKKGIFVFAVMDGGTCFCSKASLGEDLTTDNCDTPCSGNLGDFCGGVGAASVFTMIDCLPPSAQEEKEDLLAKQADIMNSYSVFEDESCGQDKDNAAEVGGSDSLSGTEEECKVACWQAKGAGQCHGFTYDKMLAQCRFHYDVFAGSIVEKPGLTCFWKKT